MENKVEKEFYAKVIKWQEEVMTKESNYSDGSGVLKTHYSILNHEAVVIFDKNTGEASVVRHK